MLVGFNVLDLYWKFDVYIVVNSFYLEYKKEFLLVFYVYGILLSSKFIFL